ncbi:MAG TPA: DoxX family protein [Balneolaceae bacterium]|nr:DoxX family protein [Balneolaceae bacterium]
MLISRRNKDLQNIGLLILRIGLGIMLVLHGYPKVFGGPETWTEVGSAMHYLGIDAAPMFFGFMAGVTEFFGGIFLLLGLFFTPAVILLFIVMIVATIQSIGIGEGFAFFSHSIEMGIVFLSLLLIGPGKYSLDRIMSQKSRRRF